MENSYFVDALAVDEDVGDTGIGSKLIELLKQKATEDRFDVLSPFLFADNVNARRFYERHGFVLYTHVDIRYHERLPHRGGSLLLKCELQAWKKREITRTRERQVPGNEGGYIN